MKEFIAYAGAKFQIEWFYDSEGVSKVLEYADEKLSKIEKARLLLLFERMGDIGQIRDITKFRNEGDGIYAFKPKPHRFLCFFYEGGKIILTNAFSKRQDKLPSSEKRKAMTARNDYNKRILKGDYYEK